MTYKAEGGKVYVREDGVWREVTTAVTAGGRDLAAFDRALDVAREQLRADENVITGSFEGGDGDAVGEIED